MHVTEDVLGQPFTVETIELAPDFASCENTSARSIAWADMAAKSFWQCSRASAPKTLLQLESGFAVKYQWRRLRLAAMRSR